jgi:hypothetical protein
LEPLPILTLIGPRAALVQVQKTRIVMKRFARKLVLLRVMESSGAAVDVK